MNNKKINYIFFIVCVYGLVFEDFIAQFISFFGYFDEIIACCFIVIFPIKKMIDKDFKIKRENLTICIMILGLICSGIAGNIINKYQMFYVYIRDVLIVLKFFLVYFLSMNIWDSDMIRQNNVKILGHVKIISGTLFVCTIINYIFKIWPEDSRFGIMANKIFYTHQTVFAGVCIFLMSLVLLCSKNNKIEKKVLIINFIMLLSTLRFKAIGGFFVSIYCIYYVYEKNKKITISKLAIVGILICILVWNQISLYYLKIEDSARSVLTMTSIKILKEHFPIGTGFGTFASYISGCYYSEVYDVYGISNVHGITRKNTSFISDTFWPMIIGQFGIIGLICYIIIIIVMMKKIQNEFDVNYKNWYLSKMIVLSYLIIISTSESAFVHSIAVPFAIILGMRFNQDRKNDT